MGLSSRDSQEMLKSLLRDDLFTRVASFLFMVPSFCVLLNCVTLLLLMLWNSKLKKRISVGAKEESWVSAEEILKSLLRDS